MPKSRDKKHEEVAHFSDKLKRSKTLVVASQSQVTVKDNLLAVTCKCGTRSYKPPTGTTDTFMSKLPSIGLKSETASTGALVSSQGPVFTPVEFLTTQEATILRAFAKNLRERELEPHIFHVGCFEGDPENPDNEVGMKIAHNEVILVCPCRQLHWRGSDYPTLTQ